ncbi:MAG: 50S ribosomal protein L19e [Candidatus Micrarchaeota archaeon]
MSLTTVRRLAAGILEVGETHVKILDAKRASEALTRDDVRALIKDGVIVSTPKKGIGRSKARWKQARKKLGRRVGLGSRKGRALAKVSKKTRWMAKVRSLRKVLHNARPLMKKGGYRKLYLMVKGGYFRSKKQLAEFLKEQKLFK